MLGLLKAIHIVLYYNLGVFSIFLELFFTLGLGYLLFYTGRTLFYKNKYRTNGKLGKEIKTKIIEKLTTFTGGVTEADLIKLIYTTTYKTDDPYVILIRKVIDKLYDENQITKLYGSLSYGDMGSPDNSILFLAR